VRGPVPSRHVRRPIPRKIMKLGIKPLTEQQELVMRLRGEEGMSYREFAARLGVRHHRVRRMDAEA